MKIKKIILIFIACFCLTGCTKYISDDNNKRIINEETGQSLPSNILCNPTTSELDEIYNKYKAKLEVDLDKLPECENLKYYDSNNYNGLWVQLIVMPLAWLIIKIGNFLADKKVSIFSNRQYNYVVNNQPYKVFSKIALCSETDEMCK